MVILNEKQLNKLRHIEIKVKKILRGVSMGNIAGKKKGFGLDFDQLSEYQFGDDVRFIDWKSSARMQRFMIKNYLEDVNRQVFLLVDVSGSTVYGSSDRSKASIIAEITAAISLAALYCKDSVGAIFFSNVVEHFIPLGKGIKHWHTLVSALFNINTYGKKTDIREAIKVLTHKLHGEALIFIITDGIQELLPEHIKGLAKKNDVIVLRCLDDAEIGTKEHFYVHMQDLEDNRQGFFSMGPSSQMQVVGTHFFTKQANQLNLLGIDCFDVATQKNYLEKVIKHIATRT